MLALEEDLIVPVYFGADGIFVRADVEVADGKKSIEYTVINDGQETTIHQYVISYAITVLTMFRQDMPM